MKEEKYIEDMVGKRNAFRVPDGYFDNFTAQMMLQLPEKPVAAMKELKPRAKSIWLRPIFYAAASVCAIVISATIWFAMPSEQSATTQVQAQKVLQQDEADTYIDEAADYMMLDNHDIYAYLSEN